MTEVKSMPQETITVELKKIEEDHVMAFKMEEDNEILVPLTKEGAANALKNVFLKLLERLLHADVILELCHGEDYSTILYIDVCKSYIATLNGELHQVAERIRSEFFTE